MLESRRRELEQRMREREEYSGPGEPVWWDDEEGPEEQLPPRQELPSPWIEEREAPIQFQAPPPPREEPEVVRAAPMQRQTKRASAQPRTRLSMLATREGLRQAIIAREVLGPPVALRPFDEERS